MQDFSLQYQKEMVNQEIKSNKRTILGFYWFFGAVFLTWLFTMLGIFIISKQMMTICFIVTVLTLLVPMYIRLKVNLKAPWVKYVLLTLCCINCAIITSILSIHAILIFPIPLVFACQYRKRKAIWYVFAVSSLTMSISCYISYYFGICDLNLLLESSATKAFYMSNVVDGYLRIPFNTNVNFIIAVYQILPRTAILLIYTIMFSYTIKSNYDDAVRIGSLTHSKDTDAVSGLYNKTKLEEMIKEHYPKLDRVAVAFFDLNNLKTINDKYGHDKGDYLIQAFSGVLMSKNNHRCNAYRFGGDEFLLTLDYAANGEMPKLVSDIKNEISMLPAIEGIKISAAAGVSYGSGKEIEELIKSADEEMYKDKIMMKGSAR